MNRPLIHGTAIAALTMALGACAEQPSLGPGEVDFGNAVRHNAAVQIANPQAAPGAGSADFAGPRAARAINRYMSDNVKPPAQLRTSDVVKSGGE